MWYFHGQGPHSILKLMKHLIFHYRFIQIIFYSLFKFTIFEEKEVAEIE